MKLSIINRFIAMFAMGLGFLLCGCGQRSAEDVASSISSGSELSADDFDCMISYNAEACDSLAAGYGRAVTMADVDRITAAAERSFPYRQLFAKTLLLNYSRLSARQTEQIARMQQELNNAFPNH